MDEDIETLIVDVRANTSSFRSDIESMRATLDTSLVGGFEKAGTVLEKGLLSAIRKGSLGFDDLKRTALSALREIATQAVQSGLSSLFSGTGSNAGGSNGLTSLFTGLVGSLFGAPGRATGGPVAPGSSYLVGERGPELFIPTSSGRVENNSVLQGASRDVQISINLSAPSGTDSPVMLQRSSRQIASAVARAMREG